MGETANDGDDDEEEMDVDDDDDDEEEEVKESDNVEAHQIDTPLCLLDEEEVGDGHAYVNT